MKVLFKEEGHSYTHIDQGVFTSVTTIIKHFTNPFDAAYWSDYKAIKDVMERKGIFAEFKVKCGGWEKVVDAWRKRPMFIDEVLDRKNAYLKMWEEKKNNAAIRGTNVHLNQQQRILQKTFSKQDGVNVESVNRLMEYPDFTASVVYTEAVLYNEFYKVAGQADKVIQKKRLVEVRDYKTNQEITETGFMNQMMKGPLSELPDCKMSHFTMQLSTYAWMLEQVGFRVGKLVIEHITTGKAISVPYRYDLVPKMLMAYAKGTL